MPGRLFRSLSARQRLSFWSGPPRLITNGFRACTIIPGFVLLASCGPYYRAHQARAAEIHKLQHETFAEAAKEDAPPGEEDPCANVSCAPQEAGFAYAKKNNMANPDGCLGKGDAAFVEGCRTYGEDIEQAYQRFVHEG